MQLGRRKEILHIRFTNMSLKYCPIMKLYPQIITVKKKKIPIVASENTATKISHFCDNSFYPDRILKMVLPSWHWNFFVYNNPKSTQSRCQCITSREFCTDQKNPFLWLESLYNIHIHTHMYTFIIVKLNLQTVFFISNT